MNRFSKNIFILLLLLLNISCAPDNVRELAKLEAELEKSGSVIPPEKRVISIPSYTEDPVRKAYLDKFIVRFDECSNRNPRESLKGQYGSGRFVAEIGLDGQVNYVQILKSSGYTELDEYVMALIKECSPFDPIPESIQQVARRLEVIKTFRYERGEP